MAPARHRVPEEFPYPIALPYALVFDASQPASLRRWALCFTQYPVLRVVTLPLVGQYLEAEELSQPDPETVRQLNIAIASIRAPIFSDWIDLAFSLRKHFPKVGIQPFFPGLGTALDTLGEKVEARPVDQRGRTLLNPHEAILALRNKVAHGGLFDEAEAELHIQQCLPVLYDVLEAFDFLRDHLLKVRCEGTLTGVSRIREGEAPSEPPQTLARQSAAADRPRGITKTRSGAETIAALWWLGWNRYSEVAGLKRFKTGRGGSDVFVVRPRLRKPAADGAWLESSGPAEVLDATWGSCLLVKTGPAEKVRKEWKRCNLFLSDRLHPFLARCEAFLAIRSLAPEDQAPEPPRRAILVNSFMGGDLLHPDPLEEIIRGACDLGHLERLLDKVGAVLAPWQAHAKTRRLVDWQRVYLTDPKTPGKWVLFNKFDLTRKRGGAKLRGREEFSTGLQWDTSFISEDHLHEHLMGKGHAGGGPLHWAVLAFWAQFDEALRASRRSARDRTSRAPRAAV